LLGTPERVQRRFIAETPIEPTVAGAGQKKSFQKPVISLLRVSERGAYYSASESLDVLLSLLSVVLSQVCPLMG